MGDADTRRVGIIYHPDKPRAKTLASEVEEWLRKKRVPCEQFRIHHGIPLCYWFVVVLGGDGYLMHLAATLAPHKIPVLGINAGDKGFLTLATVTNWRSVLGRVIRGNCEIEQRLVLEVGFGDKIAYAVNDAYIRHPNGMVVARVQVNEKVVYRALEADGIVVASPVGSTAYNMSAGGPIVAYGMDCFVVTPIASTQFNAKPFVIPSAWTVCITQIGTKAQDKECGSALVVDGKTVAELYDGDSFKVSASALRSHFISLKQDVDFFVALHNKAGLLE